jgi:hypothetical protein
MLRSSTVTHQKRSAAQALDFETGCKVSLHA